MTTKTELTPAQIERRIKVAQKEIATIEKEIATATKERDETEQAMRAVWTSASVQQMHAFEGSMFRLSAHIASGELLIRNRRRKIERLEADLGARVAK